MFWNESTNKVNMNSIHSFF